MIWKHLPRLHNPGKWLSQVLYFFALTQTCYCTGRDCEVGFWLLISGWYELTIHDAGVSWLANPLLFFSWRQYEKRPVFASLLSLMALTYMLSFLLHNTAYDNELDYWGDITSYGAGYFLWIASALAIPIGYCFTDFKN